MYFERMTLVEYLSQIFRAIKTCWARTCRARKVKLDDVSKILGLSGKPVGIDGSRVEEMVLAGQIEEVARYCETDVVNTYRVSLVYELFRGSITAEQLDWSEKQIREFAAIRRAANPHWCAALGI
jgi:3'-5' exonuclease